MSWQHQQNSASPTPLTSVEKQKRDAPEKREIEIQTETHPIASYKDPKYTWNEWELRRRAIQMVDLKHKQTHSTQTEASNFRRENDTQHYEPKVQETQTGISKGVNAPTKKAYLTGLRGNENVKMKVVNVSLDL